MAKFTISREEQIPFRESDWTVMQMVQHRIWVTVVQEENETLEDIEKQLDIVFNRNYEKTLAIDPVYQRQKKQLNFLQSKIKELLPMKYKSIILSAKKITNDK